MIIIRILGALAILALSVILLSESIWIYFGRLSPGLLEVFKSWPLAAQILILAENISITNGFLPLTNVAAIYGLFSLTTFMSFLIVVFFLLRDMPGEAKRP